MYILIAVLAHSCFGPCILRRLLYALKPLLQTLIHPELALTSLFPNLCTVLLCHLKKLLERSLHIRTLKADALLSFRGTEVAFNHLAQMTISLDWCQTLPPCCQSLCSNKTHCTCPIVRLFRGLDKQAVEILPFPMNRLNQVFQGGWMVDADPSKSLDSTIQGAMLIHRMPDPLCRNINSLRFVVLERRNRGALELPVSTGGGKVLANRRGRS